MTHTAQTFAPPATRLSSKMRSCRSLWVAAASLILALQGCGGRGAPATQKAEPASAPAPAPAPASTPAPAPAPAPTTTTLTGQVVPVGAPVTVTAVFKDPAKPDATITVIDVADSSGAYALDAPISVLPKSSQVAVVVTAPGYLPTTVIYATDASGIATPVSAVNALGTQSASAAIVLAPVNPDELVFPRLHELIRLGDGNTRGIVNSQLQLPPPPSSSPLTFIASERVPYPATGRTQLTISLLARGVEATDCPGSKVVVKNLDSSGNVVASQSKLLADSALDGAFGAQIFQFGLDPLLLGGSDFVVEVHTGQCDAINLDDMEFVGVAGKLS